MVSDEVEAECRLLGKERRKGDDLLLQVARLPEGLLGLAQFSKAGH